MNLIRSICALFTIKGKQERIELVSAEVSQKGVFLHPKDDSEHSLFVKSNSVDIIIAPESALTEDDILIIDNKKNGSIKTTSTKERNVPDDLSRIYPRSLSSFMPSKKRFSVLLYQDEYDLLMNEITDKGYKKVEYFLACMTAAKKQSMTAAYKRYTNEHAKRQKIYLSEAKKAQEEDYMMRKKASEQIQEASVV